MLRLLAFPFLYGGLLSIGVALDNPLGTDACDFPALAFQKTLIMSCEAFFSGSDALDFDAGWWAKLAPKGPKGPKASPPPQPQQQKQPAAPPPAPAAPDAVEPIAPPAAEAPALSK